MSGELPKASAEDVEMPQNLKDKTWVLIVHSFELGSIFPLLLYFFILFYGLLFIYLLRKEGRYLEAKLATELHSEL